MGTSKKQEVHVMFPAVQTVHVTINPKQEACVVMPAKQEVALMFPAKQTANVAFMSKQKVNLMMPGYSETPELEIIEGPTAPIVGQSSAYIAWTTSTAAYHRVRHRGEGQGDDDWIVTDFSAEASTDAYVHVTSIPCAYEIREYQAQSCLIGDGTQATDWTPETPDTFDLVRVNDIILSNFNVTKMPFPPDSAQVLCEADDGEKATNCKIKTRWKKSGGSWTTHPNFSTPSTTPTQIFYNLTLKPSTAYIYEIKKADLCNNESAWGDQHGFSTTAGNEIYNQW